MTIEIIRQKAQHIYNLFSQYITAIYYGGSNVSGFIKNPHDIDFITFVPNKDCYNKLKILYSLYKKEHPEVFEDNECWVQIRFDTHIEIKYWSYLYKDMILLAGTPITFNFDPINNQINRKQYIQYLQENVANNTNLKLFYHYYRAYLILSKNSYDLTEEEIQKLNILHDAKTEEDLIKEIESNDNNDNNDNNNIINISKRYIHVSLDEIKYSIWGLK